MTSRSRGIRGCAAAGITCWLARWRGPGARRQKQEVRFGYGGCHTQAVCSKVFIAMRRRTGRNPMAAAAAAAARVATSERGGGGRAPPPQGGAGARGPAPAACVRGVVKPTRRIMLS